MNIPSWAVARRQAVARQLSQPSTIKTSSPLMCSSPLADEILNAGAEEEHDHARQGEQRAAGLCSALRAIVGVPAVAWSMQKESVSQ